MLVGALFWGILSSFPNLFARTHIIAGITADIIGRKFAFNVSLMLCSVFAIVAGASPNWTVLGLFVCLCSFGAGGNLVLDTASIFCPLTFTYLLINFLGCFSRVPA